MEVMGYQNVEIAIKEPPKEETFAPEKLTWFMADRNKDSKTILILVDYNQILFWVDSTITYAEIKENEVSERIPSYLRDYYTNFRPVPSGTTITFG